MMTRADSRSTNWTASLPIIRSHCGPSQCLADRGELNVRAFHPASRQPATAEQVDKVVAEIKQQKTFQGNDYFDNVGWGESTYGPVTTQLLRPSGNTKPEDMAQFRRIATALAERGLYSNSHVEMTDVIDAFLNEYEEINKVTPIKGLRWSFSHLD